MELPSVFASNIQTIYGEAGKTWLQQLPSHLELLSKRWDFRFIQPLVNLSYSFVGLVEFNTSHEMAILKTAPHAGSIVAEVRWLKYFKEGVPHIFNVDEEQNAFLMERLEPGHPLKLLVKKGQDESATRIICQTILQLQSAQSNLSTSAKFKHLAELVTSLTVLRGHLDKLMLSRAETLFRDLSADRTHDVLLHGDLHHDNILASGASWKVIDPHGYIGDPAAEVGPMIHNPFDCFPTDRSLKKVIDTRLKILSEMLPFDAKRIQAWTFCLTILSIAWDFEDHGKIDKEKMELAQTVASLKI